MIPFEKTYDIKELARHNLHIHTTNSGCAKPEMILRDIIKEAERCSLKTIALTDHSNLGDEDRIVRIGNARLHKELKEIETDVKVLIGSEVSVYGFGKYSETKEVNDSLEFRLYSQNHYHVSFWEHPEDRSPRGYVRDMIRNLEELFRSGRADAVAHPFSGGYIHAFEDKTAVPNAFTDNELGDILTKARDADCAFEINVGPFISMPEFSRRYFNIGKEVGVAFTLGTDAHTLNRIDTMQFVDDIIGIIG